MPPSVEEDLSPLDFIFRTSMQVVLTRALAVAAELGVADLVSERPKAAAELATATGADQDSLYRLLRMLASHGVFSEREDGRFELTPIAATLRSIREQPGMARTSCRLGVYSKSFSLQTKKQNSVSWQADSTAK